MKINVKSVITSGLIAGLLISLSAITMVPVAGNEMDQVLESRGLPPLSTLAMLYFVVLSFIRGIFLILLYVLVKERLGAGIKTAVIVSVVFWFLTYFLSNVSLAVYGFMPVRLTVIGIIWGLGELIIGGIVGSRLYKEVRQ
ncbi:MAG: hypothetical protein IPJ16_16055 [Bacteroidales bacterium]|nr:hypothetical protein [Bacteroidales bacterium]